MTDFIDLGSINDIPLRGARVVRTHRGDIAVFRTATGNVYALDEYLPGKAGPEFSCRGAAAESRVVTEGFDSDHDVSIDQRPRQVERFTLRIGEQISGLFISFGLKPGHLLGHGRGQGCHTARRFSLRSQQVKWRSQQDFDVVGGDTALNQALSEAMQDEFWRCKATGQPRRQGDYHPVTGDDMLPQRRAAEGLTEGLRKGRGESCSGQARRAFEVREQRSRADVEGQRASGGEIEVNVQERTLRRGLTPGLQCKVQPPSGETVVGFYRAVSPPGADLGFISLSVVAAHDLTTCSGTQGLKSSFVHRIGEEGDMAVSKDDVHAAGVLTVEVIVMPSLVEHMFAEPDHPGRSFGDPFHHPDPDATHQSTVTFTHGDRLAQAVREMAESDSLVESGVCHKRAISLTCFSSLVVVVVILMRHML